MALVKISDLPVAEILDGAELLEVTQNSVSKQVTLAQLAAEVEALGQFSILVGDGIAVNIAVTHNLNSRNLHVTVRRETTPFEQILCDNEASSVNQITLKFGAIAPASNSFRVTISK